MTHDEQLQRWFRLADEHRAQKQMWEERERKERQAQELLTLQLQIQATRTHHWLAYMMFNPSPKPEVAAAILGKKP